MAKHVHIPLVEPIEGHNEVIREIVLRQPTYEDYVSCGGEPYTVGQSEEGVLFQTENATVIWAYAEACIVSPKDKLLLEDQGPGSWRVAREVRKAILGFFREPAKAAVPSQTSPTTSSSNSTSPSTPSDG